MARALVHQIFWNNRRTETVKLVSVDAASHRPVTWTQTPDPAGFKAVITKMLDTLAGNGGDLARTAQRRAALEKISISGENRCRDEIDTTTGLAVRAECSLAQTVTDGDKIQSSSELWTITQSLTEKS